MTRRTYAVQNVQSILKLHETKFRGPQRGSRSGGGTAPGLVAVRANLHAVQDLRIVLLRRLDDLLEVRALELDHLLRRVLQVDQLVPGVPRGMDQLVELDL